MNGGLMHADTDILTVTFSSGQMFAIAELVCDTADCDCQEIILDFTEINSRGDRAPRPTVFRLPLDLRTWQPREDVAGYLEKFGPLVDEFLRDLTDDLKKRFRERYGEAKTHARRKASFQVTSEDIETGLMLSFAAVFSDKGSILSGGSGVGFVFEMNGVEYFIDDLYCVNPDCDCRNSMLAVFRKETEGRVVPAFDAMLGFDGRVEKVTPFECDKKEAVRIISAWRESEADLLSYLQQRYEDIKDVGLANKKRLAGAKRRAAEPVTRKIGRNDPCPCGSGKKYKKCCLGNTG